jgi:hypothetical protein
MTQFEDVVIDIGRAGDYVQKVDTKIKGVKNIYQGVKSEIKWSLQVKDLVAYAVSCINIMGSSAISQNKSAMVMCNGMKPDFRKELPLAFGVYCEVYHRADNTARCRRFLCLALYLWCNSTRLWEFFNLYSKTRIHCSQGKR